MITKRLSPIQRVWTMALAVMLMQLMVVSAYAQMASGDVLAPYKDFRPPQDLATRVMEGLLGANYTSPFTAGAGASSLFGAVFLVFNVIVFAVGTVWASYGIGAGVLQTAHEGAVLGKRMNALWMPIRMVVGFGGLVPAFGGFSLSQVVMILFTSWGISFGNYAYDQALRLASSTVTLTSPAFTRADPRTDGSALARGLFEQRMCEHAYEQYRRDIVSQGATLPPDKVLVATPFGEVVKNSGAIGRALGTSKDPKSCFAVGIKRKTSFFAGDAQGRSSDSMLGFRSNAVNYQGINQQVWSAYARAWPQFESEVRAIADGFYAASMAYRNGSGTEKAPASPEDALRIAGGRYASSVLAATKEFDGSVIKQAAVQNMAKYGFFSAGSYYSTFAEANSAVMEASDAAEFIILAPANGGQSFGSGEYAPLTFNEQGGSSSCGSFALGSAVSFGGFGTDTGNCSLGQYLTKKIIELGANGSGGSEVMVDPIIALKNIGDYMMVSAETIWIAGAFTSSLAEVTDKVPGASTVMSGVSSVASKLGLGALASKLGALLPILAGLMFAVGALCAIYMPMVPFIHWVSALVQYMSIVVQSFAAAPLWALAHLQPDGDGLGQRTEKGYLYILNLLFRPILMVVGFFAAAALTILLGSVIFQMFMPAVAAAQGNSVTGIFSIVGYVFLFFVTMNTLVQGLFNLVFELADDVIGWVGGVGRSTIGREVEGKTSNLFVAGGRFGSGVAGTVLKSAPPDLRPGNGNAAGAGGARGGGGRRGAQDASGL